MVGATELKARALFLTGATGLIGGALLHRFVSHTRAKVYCLVRQMGTEQAPLERLHSRLNGSITPEQLHDRVVPVLGDLRKSNLGIEPRLLASLKRDIDIVFHCAATTSFLARKECWDTNVDGLRALINFMKTLNPTPPLFYFGSASACGARRNVCITEESYPDPYSDHYVEYTRTKASAEFLLEEEASNVETVILRPSLVLPDELITQTVARQSIWPLLLMKECRALPLRGDARIDVVPLSYVADFTLRIATEGRRHQVYHLSAGASHATLWSTIMEIVADFCSPSRPISCLTGNKWKAARHLLSRREIAHIRRIQYFIPFINQNVTFDNIRLLEEFGGPKIDTFSIGRYLPPLLARVGLSEAIDQSKTD